MSIGNVIHLMLRGNDVRVLGKLKEVYLDMAKICGEGDQKMMVNH